MEESSRWIMSKLPKKHTFFQSLLCILQAELSGFGGAGEKKKETFPNPSRDMPYLPMQRQPKR